MQLNVIKQEIGTDEILNNANLEQNIDADITLPDYCADVLRILKCIVTPKINFVGTAAGRATAEGNAQVRVIYVSSSGHINCYSQNYPFSKYVDLKDESDEICVKARAKTDYVNCRAVSSRRLDIHACVSVNFKICTLKKNELIAGVQEDEVQIKKSDITAVSAAGFVQKNFTMSETAQLSEEKPPVDCIINCSASAICSDIKVINNKLLVKGELITNVIYCSEDEEQEIETFEHSMPISQIIEINGITDENKCSVDLEIISLNAEIKADSAGENRLIDISAVVGAGVSAQIEKQVPVTVDAYSTRGEVKIEHKNMAFYSLADSFSETFLCRSQQDLSSLNAKKILAFWCSDITKNCSLKSSDFYINGTINGHFIYCDSENNIGYTERTIDFEYKRGIKDDFEDFKCNPQIQICAESVTCTSQGTADIKIEIKITCDIYSVHEMSVISSIESVEGSEDNTASGGLIIYFADSGEELWDIARRYKTSVQLIRQENSIEEETVEEKCMLLIPRA